MKVGGEVVVGLGLAKAPEDHVQARIRERRERTPGSGRIRRLRVVDVADAAELADELDAVRDARERRERIRDRLVVDLCGPRGDRGRGGVLPVVRAGDPRLGRKLVVDTELAALARARDRVEPARQDGDVLAALVLEDAELRVGVALERPVAVEVVGLEVEQHGDPRDAGSRRPRAGRTRARRRSTCPAPRPTTRGQRATDVAGDLDRATGRAEDRAEELASSSSCRSSR